jgi:hypothetical protein
MGSDLIELTPEGFDQDLRIDSVFQPLHANDSLVSALRCRANGQSSHPGMRMALRKMTTEH